MWSKTDSSSWVGAEKLHDKVGERRMFALAVMEDVKFVMRHHVYRYHQSKGGSIGNQLTHQLAACRMMVFIKKLKMRCLEFGLKLYLRGCG